MNVTFNPSAANGQISAPPSKSMAHRLLISASMCQGVSTVHGISDCEDVAATLSCLSALGVRTERSGDSVRVFGKNMKNTPPNPVLSCHESGSTLRFLIPMALLSGNTVMFCGSEGLMKRPMDVYQTLCKEKKLTFIQDGKSVTVKGPLRSGTYKVVGNISSQFISGLLFALPNLDGDSTVSIVPPIESKPYIDMTVEALSLFGVKILWKDPHTLFIKGGQTYKAADISVEGDYSGAAFPEALNLFGGTVSVDGLNPDSIQGDRVYRKYFDLLSKGTPSIYIGDCPDLGPILFAVAAAKNGGIFSGTKRLKIKESDRASAMAEELKKFGTTVTVFEDKVVVYPLDLHRPAQPLSGHNDHRIVMALSVLLSVTGGTLTGAEAVRKSYPAFFDDLLKLGVSLKTEASDS